MYILPFYTVLVQDRGYTFVSVSPIADFNPKSYATILNGYLVEVCSLTQINQSGYTTQPSLK